MNKTNSLVIILFLFTACTQLTRPHIQKAVISSLNQNKAKTNSELDKKLNSIDQRLEQIDLERKAEEVLNQQQRPLEQITPKQVEIPQQEVIPKQLEVPQQKVIPKQATLNVKKQEIAEQLSVAEAQVLSKITEENLEPVPKKINSDNKQNQLEAQAAIALSQYVSLEVVWAVPKNPADIFVIDYGFTPENLNKRLKIRAENLQNKQGFYSYKLVEIPKDQAVYFTIQSIGKLGRSEKSAVLVVHPSN